MLLALIGDRWLSSIEARQQARVVDGTQDYVRLEIEQALKRRSRVIPVLIGDAAPPPMDTLPPSLHLLMRLQMQHVDLEHIDAVPRPGGQNRGHRTRVYAGGHRCRDR